MTSGGVDALTIRLAALVIAYDGKLPAFKAKNMAKRVGYVGELRRKPDGTSRGQISSEVIRRASRRLIDEDLIRRVGDDFIADDLGDLADWLAAAIPDCYEPETGFVHPATIERRMAKAVSS